MLRKIYKAKLCRYKRSKLSLYFDSKNHKNHCVKPDFITEFSIEGREEDVLNLKDTGTFPSCLVTSSNYSKTLFIGGSFLQSLTQNKKFKKLKSQPQFIHSVVTNPGEHILSREKDLTGIDRVYWSLFEIILFRYHKGKRLHSNEIDPHQLSYTVYQSLKQLLECLKSKLIIYLVLPPLADMMRINRLIKGRNNTKKEIFSIQSSMRKGVKMLYYIQEYLFECIPGVHVLWAQDLLPEKDQNYQVMARIIADDPGYVPSFTRTLTVNGLTAIKDGILSKSFFEFFVHTNVNEFHHLLRPKAYAFLLAIHYSPLKRRQAKHYLSIPKKPLRFDDNTIAMRPSFRKDAYSSQCKTIQEQQQKCDFCFSLRHLLPFCSVFKTKTLQEKLKFISDQLICPRCLEGQHSVPKCPYEIFCNLSLIS